MVVFKHCVLSWREIFLFLRDFGDGNWLSSYDEIRQLNYSLHHISSHRTLCWSLRSIPLEWGIFQPKVFQEMINESWIVISIFNQLLSELTRRPKHSGTSCKFTKPTKLSLRGQFSDATKKCEKINNVHLMMWSMRRKEWWCWELCQNWFSFFIMFQVVIVGNGAVGKSSMIQRYCKGIFTRNYKKTIGVDFLEKHIT